MEQRHLRFILLTQDDYEHRYVANRLASECPLKTIIVDKGKPKSSLAKFRSLVKRYTFGQLCSRAISRVFSIMCMDANRQKHEMFRVLGKQLCEKQLHEQLIHFVHGNNSEESYNLIKSLMPDVILIYGTSVISDRILSLARKEALNMHTGISPYYRGAGCAFWPLYNNEPELLGATVHQCTSQIDGGMIYGTFQAQLEADDNLFSVFARCVKAGTDLYVKVARDLVNGRLHGTVQQLYKGREYKAAIRGWREEIAVRQKIRRGLIRNYVSRRHKSGTEPICPD
jgi:methionyl-tRNA formyltransferase